MRLDLFGRLAGTALMAMGLSACIDVSIDVEITSPTTARATMTQVMGADFYAMVNMSEESGEMDEGSFCGDEGTLTENADGSGTCTMVEEGPFDSLDLGQEAGGITFAAAGPGLVRVALPTDEMMEGMDAEEDMDEESRQMMEAFFAGRTITIGISGAQVVETNMTLSGDGRRAEQVIPLLDLVNGTADLPDELFAVVRAP